MTHHYARTCALMLAAGLCFGSVSTMPVEARTYQGSVSYTREMRAADYNFQTGKYKAAEAQYAALLKKYPGSASIRGGLAAAQAELYKLDAAEKNAREALRKEPKNAMANMAMGVIYRNRTASLDMEYRGRRQELLSMSARHLEQAVATDGRSPEIHNQLGTTYRFQGRFDEASREFSKALELDPKYAEAMVNQGAMKIQQGDVESAKSLLNKAIRLNSKNYSAHFRLGEAYLAQGNAHEALKSLNTALTLDPGNAAILTAMAQANDMQGNNAGAVANYRKAIQSNPQYMPAYMGIANLFDSRGDGEMAMAELKSALNVNPEFSAGRNQLGRLALTVDKPDQALRYYKESLQRDPNDAEALQGVTQALAMITQRTADTSQTLGSESDLATAEKTIEEALQLNPNDLRLHLAYLRISQLAGKPAASEQELQKIVAMPPQNESQEMVQGEAYLALGRYAEADAVFERLMQRNANNESGLLLIGDTLKMNGDLVRARDAYEMVLQNEPDNLKAQRAVQRIDAAQAESQKTLRLAQALNNWRQKKSAVDYYEESLAKNPRQPDARLALAKLYERYDEYLKAAQSYQHYLGLVPDLKPKDRERYEKKISHLRELAAKQDVQKPAGSNP